jgi:hypothetical protein
MRAAGGGIREGSSPASQNGGAYVKEGSVSDMFGLITDNKALSDGDEPKDIYQP